MKGMRRNEGNIFFFVTVCQPADNAPIVFAANNGMEVIEAVLAAFVSPNQK